MLTQFNSSVCKLAAQIKEKAGTDVEPPEKTLRTFLTDAMLAKRDSWLLQSIIREGRND